MSFEEYCVEILNIPYYNFLSKEEWENCYDKYEIYINQKWQRETGRCSQCGNYINECGCDR
jgi:hypothetical protein